MTRAQIELVPEAERFVGIGGSDIAALLGMETGEHARGPIDVYNEQVALSEGLERAEDDVTPRDPRWWGIRQEPIIVEAWEFENPDYIVEHAPIATVRHAVNRFWRATPDAFAYDSARHQAMVSAMQVDSERRMREEIAKLGHRDHLSHRSKVQIARESRVAATAAFPPDLLLECKAHRSALRFQYGEEGTDDVPPAKRAQVYWTAGLLGIEVGALPVLFDTNQPRWFRVELDRDVLAAMLEHADTFMRNHVARRIPPPPDGSTSRERYIKEHLGQDDGTEVVATTDVEDDVDEIRRLKLAVKMAEAQISVRSQRVREFMAAASTLRGDGGKKLATWKRNARGPVLHKEVAEEIAHAHGMTDAEIEKVRDRHRGEAPRVFKVADDK